MRYLGLTENDRQKMMDDIQISSIDELYDAVEDSHLLKKAKASAEAGRNDVIKTWSRRSTILPEFVGLSFAVHNGRRFIPVNVSEDMVGHKLGEFSPTRSFFGHTPADKKAKPAEAGVKK